MKAVTVLGAVGSPTLSFTADTFLVDENGYLTLRADDLVVAKFSPANWGGVYDQEAIA